jgi:hypothetical protein
LMVRQIPILVAGILLWGVITLIAYNRAANNFEKVDL